MQTRVQTLLTYSLLAGAMGSLGIAPLRAVDVDYTSPGLYVWAPQEKATIGGFVCINHLEDSSSFAVKRFHEFTSHVSSYASVPQSDATELQKATPQDWNVRPVSGQAAVTDKSSDETLNAPDPSDVRPVAIEGGGMAAASATAEIPTVVPEPGVAALGLLGLLALSLRRENPAR